jgi:hypothetical protein
LCRQRRHFVVIYDRWTRNGSSPDAPLGDDFGRNAAKATKLKEFLKQSPMLKR